MAGRSSKGTFEKGHTGFYKGKLDKIDLIAFGNANEEYRAGILSKTKFAKRLGVTRGTLDKYYKRLCDRVDEEVRKGNLEWSPLEERGGGL